MINPKQSYLEQADRHVEAKRGEFIKSFEQAEKFKAFINLIPDELFFQEKASNLWTNWGLDGLTLTIPYNLTHFQELKKLLEDAGFKNTHRNDMNKDVYEYFKHPDNDMRISIDLDTAKPGAKCVVVPIKWETKQVVVATDKICPEGHPELFKKNEDGSYEYIGDELFPKPPEGVKA